MFGCYQNISKSRFGYYSVEDETCFLFSIRNEESIVRMSSTKKYKFQRFLSFGDGDLVLSNICNTNFDSYSKLGNTFELPYGILKDSEQSKSYFAGQQRF